MQVEELSFSKFKNNVRGKEGIVCLGAGGELQEWITGITKTLNDEQILSNVTPENAWTNIYKLTTSGGRIDLAFVFNKDINSDETFCQ